MDISKLSNEDLFSVLLCGVEPIEPYNIQDYVVEWNKRCIEGNNKDGRGYSISC